MNTLELAYWDVYHEAYGFRPRNVDFTMWNEDTFKDGIELCLAYIRERDAGRPLEAPISHEQRQGEAGVA